MYDFLFNSRMGLGVLFIAGMILFAIVALLLERGTRAKYRDRPAPQEDVEFARPNRQLTKEEREKLREERLNKARETISEGGIAGMLGIGFDDDEVDE